MVTDAELKALEGVDAETRATFWRAVAIENTISAHRGSLLRPDLPADLAANMTALLDRELLPPEVAANVDWGALRDPSPEARKAWEDMRAQAVRDINAAWKALAGRRVDTEDRRRVVEAVETAARTPATGRDAAEAALAVLPPALAALLAPRAEALGRVVEAWRDERPGRKRGPGKYKALAELWNEATGAHTTDDDWETARKALRSSVARVAE